MRSFLAVMVVCLSGAGVSLADPAVVHVRLSVNVPPEPLASALHAYSQQTGFHVVYISEDVRSRRSAGAVGKLTVGDALTLILKGTGLTYRFLDPHTISIVPASSGNAPPSGAKEGKTSSSGRFPVAQATSGSASSPAEVTTEQAAGNEAVGEVTTLREVVVTAELRRERAIDVPVSMTAIDASTMRAMGATNLEDLEYTVPGFTSVSYAPGATQYVELRGVSDYAGLPTVGLYFDEMPINLGFSGQNVEVTFLDMERVEVLRGPQPALYGDGSVGGTIRYIPASPSLNGTPSGALEADYTSLQDGGTGWLTRGHVDISLIPDRVGLRLAGWYEKDGGWIDRAPTGQNNINSTKIGTARATLLVKTSDRTKLKLLWQHGVTRVPNQNFGDDDVTRLFVPSYNYQDSDLLEAVFTADLGFAQLVETPDYMRLDVRFQADLSPFYVPDLSLLGIPPGYVTEIADPAKLDSDMLYNEIRLVSSTSGPWSWAAGFDFKNTRYTSTSATTTAPNPLPFALLASNIAQPAKTEALWGEVGYELTDRWHADIGVRYFRDRTQYFTDILEFGAGVPTANSGTFTSTDPRLDVRYTINPHWNVYFNVGKGFRSGGFNAGYAASPAYTPDQLWTEELGSKGLFFERKLELDADVYYNDWSNVQSELTTPAGLEEVYNTGRIAGMGFDWEAALRPLPGLELGTTFGWNNMSYKEVPPNLTHAVGDPPDLAVRESWSGFAEYRRPIGPDTSLYGRAGIQHADRAQNTLRSTVYAAITNLPPRSLLDLRLGLSVDRYDISVYVENALNERNPIIQAPLGVITEDVSQRPRLYGVALRATF